MEYLEPLKILGHFLISFGVVYFLRKKGVPVSVAILVGLGLGLSKELLDISMRPSLHFEWNDMHVNFIGCLGAMLVSA